MTRQYRSEVLASVHETALGMTEAGVMTKMMMKVFDELCLPLVEDMAPGTDTGNPAAGECEPGGVRALPQLDDGAGEPVGARREAPARPLAQVADAGGQERPRGGGVTVGTVDTEVRLDCRCGARRLLDDRA